MDRRARKFFGKKYALNNGGEFARGRRRVVKERRRKIEFDAFE